MRTISSGMSTVSGSRLECSKMVEFLDKLPVRPKDDLLVHQLEGIVRTRHHVFAAFNKYGVDVSKWANDTHFKSGDISESQAIGVDYEIIFYNSFRETLNLVPALDCGDHTDFVGFFKGHYLRIDVTGNIHEKQSSWSDYCKYIDHIVAVYDEASTEWSYYIPDEVKKCLVKVR